MNKKYLTAAILLALLAFAIPIEHKYDKLFRFFSLTLIPEGLTISSSYDKKIYFYVSDLIAVALMFIGLFWFRIPLSRFFNHPLWILLICAVASILASPFVHYPVAYVRLLQLFTPIALFSFLAFAFNGEEKQKITRVVWIAIIIAALFQSGIAIAQYFHEAPLGLRLFGETNQISTITISDGSRWTLDRLFHTTPYTLVKMRAAGTLPHANVLGGFLMLSILSTYALVMKTNKRALALTLPFQFFAMSLSFSRSAFFAWAIASSIWFGLMFLKNGLKDLRIRFLALIMVFSVASTGALLFQQIISRGGVVNYNIVAQTSDAVRVYHQNLALEIIKKTPLFGLGFNQFSDRAVDYFPPETSQDARATAPHNVFLFLACETGIISLAAFLSFILLLLWASTRTPVTLETITFTSLFIGFLFICCCDFYPILFQQGKLMFFMVAGLLAAHVVKRKEVFVYE